MADNLISQNKQKPLRQIPGAQTLCNDVADVLWWPFDVDLLKFRVSVCVHAAGESNVLLGHMTSSHVKASLQPRVDQLRRNGFSLSAWLKAAMDGWVFHCVITLEVKHRNLVLPDYSRNAHWKVLTIGILLEMQLY